MTTIEMITRDNSLGHKGLKGRRGASASASASW